MRGRPRAGGGAGRARADHIGLSEREAEALAARRRVAVQTVCRDGQALTVTADLRSDRVDLAVVEVVEVDPAIAAGDTRVLQH